MSGCNCVGPQGGQPVCPCLMVNVKVIDGRYVEVKDLGEAPHHGDSGGGRYKYSGSQIFKIIEVKSGE